MEQIPSTSPSTPSGKWYCIKCRQCDVPNAHYSKKFSNELVNSWILTYCEATRRWRNSIVVAMHPEKSAVMLVRGRRHIIIYLSSMYFLTTIIYLLSLYHLIIIYLSSDYHLCIIYLSYMYFLTTIIYRLPSNYHLSIIVVSFTYHLCIF